jgi:ABC-type transport system involved in cytochrome c biogenesis permease subunit
MDPHYINFQETEFDRSNSMDMDLTSPTLFSVSMFVYLCTSLFYLLYLLSRKKHVGLAATSLIGGGFVIHTVGFIFRWVETYKTGYGYVPLSNMYILPGSEATIKPLMPALQSNWLAIHVITCFFGYAAFAVSFGISLLFLIQHRREVIHEGIGWLPGSTTLDEINYWSIGIGFPMLTVGIITGAAWAHYAWGSYWSWDPKETWSLITWFIYAAFLHARITRDWRGRRMAILSLIGFMAVLFTYFGVSYILSGLHSYASPSW